MLSRRRFVQGSVGAVGSAWWGAAPLVRVRAAGAPADPLRVAVIGVAGQGAYNLGQVAHERVVALVDVDRKRAEKAQAEHPKARFFTDYRAMFDQMAREIDAVVLATPDHTHHHPAMMAMNLGKPVYVEKPLARTIAEVRQMSILAAQKKLATQMGTQIHAGENYRRVVEWVQSGVLGTIREVDVWCQRSPDAGRKVKAQPMNAALNLDLWRGPVAEEYFQADHGNWPHFHWRWWWAFGGGVLADMGCHFMDLAFWALELGAPKRITATGEALRQADNTVPAKLKVVYEFDRLKLTWYHGVDQPSLTNDAKQPGFANGVRFVGERGQLISDYGKHRLEPEAFARAVSAPKPTISKSIGHHREWLEAIRGNGRALCHFGYAGNLTEAVLLGNVAYRLGQPIEWDSTAMKVTNQKQADALLTREVREGWGL